MKIEKINGNHIKLILEDDFISEDLKNKIGWISDKKLNGIILELKGYEIKQLKKEKEEEIL